ncbi:uncharacterized protein LOC144325866 [Podarcis muralis]
MANLHKVGGTGPVYQTSVLEHNFFLSFLPTSFLDQKELEKRQEFQMAVDMIRTVLVGIDPVYIDKEDLEILAAAQNISEEMRYFANKNDELQKDIDILTENLNDGWVIYERTLYWFSSEVASWMDAQKNCEREGANLISAETVEEQLFLSTEVQNLKKVFWIGVFKDKGGTWKWLSGRIVSETFHRQHSRVRVDYLFLTVRRTQVSTPLSLPLFLL